MTEPVPLAMIGRAVVGQGVTFLYEQVGALLQRWRYRRRADPGGKERLDVPLIPSRALDGQPTARDADLAIVEQSSAELSRLYGVLAPYAMGLADVRLTDSDLIAAVARLRDLLEAAYGQRLTFRGEQRERTGTEVDVRQVVEVLGGKLTGIGTLSLDGGRAQVQQVVDEASAGSEIVGIGSVTVGGPAEATAKAPPRANDTRTVNPRLEAPPAVEAGTTFTLLVGIAARPASGVMTQASFETAGDTFDLTVTLLLDGFTTADGSDPIRTMRVSAQAPYPAGIVDLIAVDDPALRPARTIVATYSIDGRTLGTASTSVLVLREDQAPPAVPADVAPRQVKGWALPLEGAPDLVVTVARGNDEAGRRLQWTAESPHAEVVVPQAPVVKVLSEQSAGDWARRVMVGVEQHSAPDDLPGYLRGIQIMVGDHVPAEIWAALASAAAVAPHPAVLLTTDDPFVPWELAKVPQPWDAERADLLGAQCSLGRWTYRSDQPEPNPTHTLDVAKVAVVKGTYRGAAQLPEAEAEADHIAARYEGVLVAAELPAVLNCIKGDPEADVLHFAVHGRLDVTGLQDGILMTDKRALSPETILGQEAARPRLVFINACQVGQGQQMLGDVAGVVPSFIRIGAQAVIAPLWKVDDVAAREFAERLYNAMAAGRRVADVLAQERAAAAGAGVAGTPQSTVLAYLFFGHPRLTVTLPQGSPDAAATP